jgi:hypothetical protein
MHSRKILSVLFLGLVVIIALVLFDQLNQPKVVAASDLRPLGTPLEIKAPLGLPPVPIPADNPPTVETVALAQLTASYELRLFHGAVLGWPRAEP